MIDYTKLTVSGERFLVHYAIEGTQSEVKARAEDLCVEQTIEFPKKYIADDDIRQHILGRIEAIQEIAANLHQVSVSFANEVTGYSLTQFMNVIFGNISLQPGIRLQSFDLSESLLKCFKGPRFGRVGLRDLSGEAKAPLLCSALKPMGLSATALSKQAHQFALGGLHFIKDDHGLADQPFAPFRDRVKLCADAVMEANAVTGFNSVYVPSLSSPAERIIEDAYWAKEQGAGGFLIAPGIVGWDMMRRIAEDDALALPVFCHPSFLGSFTASSRSGLSHHALFGQLVRLAGADVTIYPNFGGRFSFSLEDCQHILEGTFVKMGDLKPIFASPGGGMNFQNIPEMLEVYGRDIMFLIGGALHQGDGDIVENSRKLGAATSI